MADADFTFDEGIDPTSTFPSAYATVLLQLVREATPNAYRGMIIYSATTPAVTGDYAWHKRCLWIKTDDWTFYFYDDDAGSWESLFSAIPADAITTAMVQDGAITLAKLAVGAGTAGQIVRINAGGAAFEFVNITDAIASGALVPAKLTPGTNGQVLWTTGGAAAWVSLTTLLGSVAAGSFPVTVLVGPGASALGKFLFADAATGAISWTAFDLNVAQAAGSVNIDMLVPGANGQMLVSKSGSAQWGSPSDLPNGSIPLARLVSGTDTHVLTMEAGLPVWKAPAAPSTTYENFCAQITATRTVSGANFVAFDGDTIAEIDDGGWEASAAGNYRIVNTGIYLVRAVLHYNGSWVHDLEIRVNGTAVRSYTNPPGDGVIVIEAMIDVTVAATDNVSINLINNSLGVGSEELLAGSTFTIQRIGDT